jgi:hypothetical protein
MIYELRTYWAAPGKIEELHNSFRNVTLNLFKRNNMQLIGFWTPSPVTAESGDLVYILAFTDAAAIGQAWKALMTEPEFIAWRKQMELTGNLTVKMTSVLLEATDYSPLR